VGPPDEDVKLLHHLSHHLLVPLVNFVKEVKVNDGEMISNVNMEETIIPSDSKKLKSRNVKRDDENEFLETEICKRSVICDDDEESDEKKKKRNLKRHITIWAFKHIQNISDDCIINVTKLITFY
jgi:hypothetical protein